MKYVFFLLFSTILTGCSTVIKLDDMTVKYKIYERKYKFNENVYFKLTYPKIKRAASTFLKDTINENIEHYKLKNVFNENKEGSIKEVKGKFFDTYARCNYLHIPGSKWFYERDIDIFVNDSIVTLVVTENIYTGGIFPIFTKNYININKNTGETTSLDDIIINDKMDDFIKFASERFVEKRNISDILNLKDTEFFDKNGLFKLNNNFIMDRNGLSIYYNCYEITPYIDGPTELNFTIDEMHDYLKSEYLFALIKKGKEF